MLPLTKPNTLYQSNIIYITQNPEKRCRFRTTRKEWVWWKSLLWWCWLIFCPWPAQPLATRSIMLNHWSYHLLRSDVLREANEDQIRLKWFPIKLQAYILSCFGSLCVILKNMQITMYNKCSVLLGFIVIFILPRPACFFLLQFWSL